MLSLQPSTNRGNHNHHKNKNKNKAIKRKQQRQRKGHEQQQKKQSTNRTIPTKIKPWGFQKSTPIKRGDRRWVEKVGDLRRSTPLHVGGGRSAPPLHQSAPLLHRSSSILPGFGFVLGE